MYEIRDTIITRKGKDPGTNHTGTKRRTNAFTLIELLTVIAIIGILISIIMPTFSQFQLRARSTSSQARILELTGGCELFFQDYGYYPGGGGDAQIRLNLTNPNQNSDEKMWGAQVLASELFGYNVTSNPPIPSDPTNPNTWQRKTNPKLYASLNPGDLDVVGDNNKYPDGVTGVNAPFVVLDRFRDAKPILYSPARLGVTINSVLDVYPQWDNRPWLYHLAGTNNAWLEWRKFIANQTYGLLPDTLELQVNLPTAANPDPDKIPFRPDTFIMIGAGADGKYLDPDMPDENSNFTISKDR